MDGLFVRIRGLDVYLKYVMLSIPVLCWIKILEFSGLHHLFIDYTGISYIKRLIKKKNFFDEISN